MYTWASRHRAPSWQTCCWGSLVSGDKSLTVPVYGAAAPYYQPIVETINAKHSNVLFDRCLHFDCDFATEVGDWGRCHGTQQRVSVVCLSTLKVSPRFGSTLWLSPAELRWTHNKIQRLLTGGQSLPDVEASLRQGAVQPLELPMFGIVRHEMKWYWLHLDWLPGRAVPP